MQIREARKEDIPKLLSLIGDVFTEYNMLYNSFDELPDFFDFDQVYVGRDNELYVLTEGNQICACGGFKFDEELSPYLSRIYVDIHHRRKGYGVALVSFLVDRIKNLGFPEVYLWTDTRFEKAHNLYEKLGFSATGKERPLHDVNISYEFEYIKELLDEAQLND